MTNNVQNKTNNPTLYNGSDIMLLGGNFDHLCYGGLQIMYHLAIIALATATYTIAYIGVQGLPFEPVSLVCLAGIVTTLFIGFIDYFIEKVYYDTRQKNNN